MKFCSAIPSLKQGVVNMNQLYSNFERTVLWCVGALAASMLGSAQGIAQPTVPRWMVFETEFTSDRHYENPVQQNRLRVEFRSPSGTTRTVYGFWDGGASWKVRFSPDEIGRWTYTTSNRDESDAGLHGQSGEFECSAYAGDIEFYKHGELKLSENRRYLVHHDGAPFFWLADTVWCGPLLSDYDDWLVFLNDRVEKEFTAIQFVMTQWRMTPTDAEGNPTYTGHDPIAISPRFFQRMDRYIEAINRSCLLAIPVLLWAIRGEENPGYSLPEAQKIILAEYMIARYGAYQVLWFLGGDGNYSGENAESWKRIGRAVFHPDQHRLASMHVGGKSWIGKEFRGEPWFDVITYQSGHGDDDGTFRWLTQGPPSREWNQEPMLPVINAEPNYEAHNGYTYRKAHSDHSLRRASYWSLLVSPTAGVTYGGQGIWGWHTKVQAPADHISTGLGSPWYEAKDLPGAVQMKYLHRFFKSIDWWRLVPAPDLLVEQPGQANVSTYVTVAKSEAGDLLVAYLPEGGEIQLKTGSLKKPAQARWYHPRTGGWLDASVVTASSQTFKTFDLNDWVLLIQSD